MGLIGCLTLFLLAVFGFCVYQIAQEFRTGDRRKAVILMAGFLLSWAVFLGALYWVLICLITAM